MGLKVKIIPSCSQQPKTMSFRETAMTKDDDIYKTINSVYFDPDGDSVDTPESWFTNSSESTGSLSTTTTEFDELSNSDESNLEAVIRGAQQSADQRLLFEPAGETSSILWEDDQNTKTAAFEESVVESENPYEDFKSSMEEMAENLGFRDDWEGMEEMLGWYLKVNSKTNHGYIIGAFLDLFVNNSNSNSNSNSQFHDDHHEIDDNKSITSFSSAASCLSSCASSC